MWLYLLLEQIKHDFLDPALSRVQLFVAPGLQPIRLLCLWDSTGAGSRFLLQGIFLTKRLNQHL